jgi:hypothetical protein
MQPLLHTNILAGHHRKLHDDTTKNNTANQVLVSKKSDRENRSEAMLYSNKEEGGDTNESLHPSASTRPKRRRDESENCEEQKASLEEAATQMDGEPSQGRWEEDLHRSFVQAIFEIGLQHSSPAVVMEEMANHLHQNITGERGNEEPPKEISEKQGKGGEQYPDP